MTESALLVELPDVDAVVASWRELYDPALPTGIPCHVTALWPFLPPSALDEAEVDRLRDLVSTVAPLRFRLVAVDQFPGVIWLRPDPDEHLRALTRAIWRAYPAFPPYGGEFPDPMPHMTVAVVEEASVQEEIRQSIADSLSSRLPIECNVPALSLWSSDDSGMWRCVERMPFHGT